MASPDVGRISEVAGRSVRTLRDDEGITQADMALRWSRAGLSWPRSKISEFENGRRTSTDLGELLTVATALGIPLVKLFEGHGSVRLTKGGNPVSLELVRRALSGDAEAGEQLLVDLEAGSTASGRPDLLERDVARRLSVDPAQVRKASINLYGHGLTDERNRQVDALDVTDFDRRRAFKGRITRNLEAAVAAKLGRDS